MEFLLNIELEKNVKCYCITILVLIYKMIKNYSFIEVILLWSGNVPCTFSYIFFYFSSSTSAQANVVEPVLKNVRSYKIYYGEANEQVIEDFQSMTWSL